MLHARRAHAPNALARAEKEKSRAPSHRHVKGAWLKCSLVAKLIWASGCGC